MKPVLSIRQAGLFFVLALGVALAARFPAHGLGERITAASGGGLHLEEAEGTVWQGRASVRLANGHRLEDIEWQFQPLGLLSLEWRYRLSSDHPGLRGSMLAGVTPGGFRLGETDLRLPARSLAALYPMAGTFSPEGWLQVRTAGLSCSRALACDGDALVTWTEAAMALAELRPLGDYQLAVQARADRFDFDLKTLKGSLRAAGKGSWQSGQGPRFTGELSAPPGELPRVQGLMRLFGEPDGRGLLHIQR